MDQASNSIVAISFYLSNRMSMPINVPANRIKPPAETKIGTAKLIARVASLRGFGNLIGVKVASSNPSAQPLGLIKFNLRKSKGKHH